MKNLQITIDWVLETAKSNKVIISDGIIPVLKEKGMKVLSEKLAKRGIQVWWNQMEAHNACIIIPRACVSKVKTLSEQGWTVGVYHDEVRNEMIMLPPMKK